MKPSSIFILLVATIISCSSPSVKETKADEGNNFGAVSQKIIDLTKSYLSSKLKSPTIISDNDGTLIFKSVDMNFQLRPSGISIGQIDEDASLDAIVSYIVIPKDRPEYTKQLLILNKGEVKVVKDFISELRVMQISNRTIFGELPKHGPNSPLHTCQECKENVKYKLVGDTLKLIK